MATYIREIRVRVYVDTNKATHDEEYCPEEDETLPELLRRLADEYEERYVPDL